MRRDRKQLVLPLGVKPVLTEEVRQRRLLFAHANSILEAYPDFELMDDDPTGLKRKRTLKRAMAGIVNLLRLGMLPEELMRGIEEYKAALKKHEVEPRFVRSPANWFWSPAVRQKWKEHYPFNDETDVIIQFANEIGAPLETARKLWQLRQASAGGSTT